MSPSAVDDSQTAETPRGQKSEKKHSKRDKAEHKKKRSRDDDDAVVVEEAPRKSKRTRSGTRPDEDDQVAAAQSEDESRRERKSKKHRKHREEEQEQPEPEPEADDKHKEKKSKKDKSKKAPVQDDATDAELEPEADKQEAKSKKSKDKSKSKESKKRASSPDHSDRDDAMDIDATQQPAPPSQNTNPATDRDFPFFTQTLSLYLPFFPVGFDKPLTNIAAQHLDPLLNHYSPMLRGVLLEYSNLNLADRPAKASVVDPPTDKTPALLYSVDEYAVGFGWLTFDARLFVPSRGKWMEGVMQLQSEGHIGVVCFDKFNASIEAKRLPKGWKWVDLDNQGYGSHSLPSPDYDGETAQQQQQQQQQQDGEGEEEDALDSEGLQVVEQMHTTGYWVNERGRKVAGKLLFRIKNFDVGLAGDYGYLSIEGTFLDDEEERALAAEEREMERRRRQKQNVNGFLRPMSRRVPEFSMTKFGKEEEEEDSAKRTVVYKGSRPGTPDD
ncbi:hypothetical protein B0T17DRAFT_489717 [Bombardia bombarda]|uniref:DNA-directed RNA polymerase subunit n=1 Tax=Bombardia bombarda TaxID=252184 RepID=A0AA39X8T7_9PEZI|nr:hypothetical protein B0T17DRAFT_489717 [Bombardia bombarda]